MRSASIASWVLFARAEYYINPPFVDEMDERESSFTERTSEMSMPSCVIAPVIGMYAFQLDTENSFYSV